VNEPAQKIMNGLMTVVGWFVGLVMIAGIW
jgi:hypothetical protein